MENNLNEMNVDLVRTVMKQAEEIEELKSRLNATIELQNERYEKLIDVNKGVLESAETQQKLTSDIINAMKPLGSGIDEIRHEMFAKYDRSTAHAECKIHDNLDLYHNIAYHIFTICEDTISHLITVLMYIIFASAFISVISPLVFNYKIPGSGVFTSIFIVIEIMLIIVSSLVHKSNCKLLYKVEKDIVVDQMTRSKDFQDTTQDDVTIERAVDTGVLFYKTNPDKKEESGDNEDGRE